MLQEQMQLQMRVEANEDYIFSYIDSPIAPEKKIKPSRFLICIMGFLLGFITSILYVFMRHVLDDKQELKNSKST